MYAPYVTPEEYAQQGYHTVPEEQRSEMLRRASRHIDSLTYNRIVGRFAELTPFQQDIIRETVCRQADFEHENADMIDSVISAYSLNGASVQFGAGWNVVTQNGVAMQRETYALLCQTGLCCRIAR